LDISFECGVLLLLMTSPAFRARADLDVQIHSGTGEREKINALITYILQTTSRF